MVLIFQVVLYFLGLIELCVVSFIQVLDVILMCGIVGFFLFNIEVWLVLVFEFNYDVLGIFVRGEICIKGKMFFFGYYKWFDFIEEVFVDGWFLIGNLI